MKPATLYNLTVDPLRSWSELAWNAGEMMLASAQVIRRRSNGLVLAGGTPDAGGRRELARMGHEKIAATSESAVAMASSWMRLNQEFAAMAYEQMLSVTVAMLSVAASRTPAQSLERQTRLVRDTMTYSAIATSQLTESAAHVAHRGLKPIHSRATGNARRLRKHR